LSTDPDAVVTLSTDPDAVVTLPTDPDPLVTVIVLAWRADQHLLPCLRTLAASEDVAFETIILLNGATPQVVAVVRDCVAGARVLESSVNLGFGGGCNRAAMAARGRHLVFLNDDTEVPPDWLAHLVATAEQDGVAAVSSRLVFPDGRLQEAGCLLWADGSSWQVGWGTADGAGSYAEPRDVPFGSAAGLLVRRSAFEAIGGYSLAYHPAYFEDADLCLRLWQEGGRVRYQAAARLVHVQSASSSLDFRDWLYQVHQVSFREYWAEVLQHAPAEPAHLDGEGVADAVGRQDEVIEAARHSAPRERGSLGQLAEPPLPDWDQDELRATSLDVVQLRHYGEDLRVRFEALSVHCHQVALERDRLDAEFRALGAHAHSLSERLDAADLELRSTRLELQSTRLELQSTRLELQSTRERHNEHTEALTQRFEAEISQLQNPSVRAAAGLLRRAARAAAPGSTGRL